ncbi:hypothetical protein OA333_01310 [Candidatus Pelagibacter sp.]|nr:hypothetical protein [Candidatus Pelagibacter sp.]
MQFKYILYLLFLTLFACEHHSKNINIKNKPEDNKTVAQKEEIKEIPEINKKEDLSNIVYSNKGFALIYSEDLDNSLEYKLDNASINILSPNLPNGTPVRITNIINGKSLITVVQNKTVLPIFYNSVITSRIASELSINPNEPYVFIETINSNNLYIANDVKTFDEEKEVANKAPVDDIMIQNISIKTEKKESNTEKFVTNFNYIIKFADFYFEDSAIMLKNRLFEEYNIENILIKKLSQNNFRVYKGPYKDFEKLKKGFHNIENLEFDSIEIIKL